MHRKSGAVEVSWPWERSAGRGKAGAASHQLGGAPPYITSQSRLDRSEAGPRKLPPRAGVCREGACTRTAPNSLQQARVHHYHYYRTNQSRDASPLVGGCRASPDPTGQRWVGCPSEIGVPLAPESFSPRNPLLRCSVF